LEVLEKTTLEELKNDAGLSNKKWDLGIKALTKAGLAKVSKVNDVLYVELV
jgi:lysyl-tRNA synthetase class 2